MFSFLLASLVLFRLFVFDGSVFSVISLSFNWLLYRYFFRSCIFLGVFSSIVILIHFAFALQYALIHVYIYRALSASPWLFSSPQAIVYLLERDLLLVRAVF